jgi:enoyl-CoA hydratase/carnithine racemase
LLTGRQIDAELAVDWGLVSRMSSHDELVEKANEALIQCCYMAPVARAEVKKSMDNFYGTYDRQSMEHSLDLGERREGWRAFKERRAPQWIPPEIRPEGRL